MTIRDLQDRLPAYAKDLRLNLGSVLGSTELSPTQLWGTALSSAIAARNPEVIAAVAAEAAPHLPEGAADAAKAAAAVMAMNNVYYRFTHLVGDAEYGQMPARLRMHAIGKPGVDKLDFELWCLAVSAINGCGSCLASHERVVRERGATAAMVQDAVRIASVIHAVAVTLETEPALAGERAAA